jgi:hypothetical protein
VKSDDKYCSPYCNDAGDTEEISCNCGHAGCSVEDSPGASGYTTSTSTNIPVR